MSEEIKIYTDTNWEDLLEYNGMTWINIDRFKSLQQKVEQLEKEKDYLDDYNRHLHNENKQLENIRKEAIEECKSVIGNPEHTIVSKNELMKIMLNILNKGDNKE